ncbi:MAG: PfkB family carbohydrate kinase [Candidatus Ratteibacteria bacterium]|nr:PfkB family carbohydrate kinase [Candidatus Ratteibacteria bacterium]
MNNKILIFGSMALDTIETPFGKRANILGGSATHAAISASYFTTPIIVSVVGEDFPDEHVQLLKKNKINIKNLQRKKGKTFAWEARYGNNPNEREVLATYENVLRDYSPLLLPEHQKIKYVFLANNSPASQTILLDQLKSVKLVVWDTMTFWIERYIDQILKILPRVDVALFNDSEAMHFSKETNLIKAGKKILSKGVKKGVVIKKGEHGSFLFTHSFTMHLPAYPIEEVKDPTGAGDSFAGGFIGFLAKTGEVSDKSLKKAMAYGTIMASLTVEEFGADRFKKLEKKDIRKRFFELKKIIGF